MTCIHFQSLFTKWNVLLLYRIKIWLGEQKPLLVAKSLIYQFVLDNPILMYLYGTLNIIAIYYTYALLLADHLDAF